MVDYAGYAVTRGAVERVSAAGRGVGIPKLPSGTTRNFVP
jgi:hypothetical protein